jgi:hypothetical protein
MLNIRFGAGAVGAGTTSRYGSGSTKIMRLLAAPGPQQGHIAVLFFPQKIALKQGPKEIIENVYRILGINGSEYRKDVRNVTIRGPPFRSDFDGTKKLKGMRFLNKDAATVLPMKNHDKALSFSVKIQSKRTCTKLNYVNFSLYTLLTF